jgi:tetratricopeptide (TPR) repeat protein
MKRFHQSWALAVLIVAALASVVAPRAAAQSSSITGQILDTNAKPWAGLTVQAVSDQGAKSEAKTDSEGKYAVRNLRPGIYTVTITAFPPPNEKQGTYEMAKVQVTSSADAKADANFKEILAKQGTETQAVLKKNEEMKKSLEALKAHVTAGDLLLAQEKQARTDLQKAPADQRDVLRQKLADLSNQTVAEYLEAQKNLVEKDPNTALVWVKLGDAYDTAGRNEEAENAYQQAITLKPDVPGYYNNLGNVLARLGKIDDAQKAYVKSAELDPANAAGAWLNFGISLSNASRLKEAVDPLKKATELDPKNAKAWYLLATALVGTIETKKVGDKLEFVIQPGTVEAYQKAIELDPNGIWGQQAKQGLDGLQQIAPGIDTKVNLKKKKS